MDRHHQARVTYHQHLCSAASSAEHHSQQHTQHTHLVGVLCNEVELHDSSLNQRLGLLL